MRILFIILTVCSWTISLGQTTPNKDSVKTEQFPLQVDGIKLDKLTVDTLSLGQFNAKKIISYKLNTATFLVDYNDFMKMYTVFWKRYKTGQNYIRDAKRKGQYYNPNSEAMWLVLDSVYKVLKSQVKIQDTIFLTHEPFNRVGFGTWNNFFGDLIEKGNCAILNNKGERQFFIIKHKGFWYRDILAAWSGRRYFFIGEHYFFIDVTDWIS